MVQIEDPRFEGTSKYDLEETIETITNFYKFLTELPYIQPDEILFPPSGGWPNIAVERLSCLDKNEEVIDLLVHLPYISVPGAEWEIPWPRHLQPLKASVHERMVAPRTSFIDHRGYRFQKAIERGDHGHVHFSYIPPYVNVSSWVILLTTGFIHGDYMLFDTSDGKFGQIFGDEYSVLVLSETVLGTVTRSSKPQLHTIRSMPLMTHEVGETNVPMRPCLSKTGLIIGKSTSRS